MKSLVDIKEHQLTDSRSSLELDALVSQYLETVKSSLRIPAGTPMRFCHKCPASIWFVGPGKVPVSVKAYKDGPPGIPPEPDHDGAGIAHFADCPKAAAFRRGNSIK